LGEAPFVLLLTGPAGAGKTTVAAEWASRRRTPTAHVSLDDVREFMKSGYANPEDGWNDETEAQYDLARELCATIATRYVEAGVACAIDDVIFLDGGPPPTASGWGATLGEVPHALVVLLPRLDVAQERNNGARDGHRRLRPETVRVIYEDMLPWHGATAPVIDNSDLSVTETVAEVDRVLRDVGLVVHG
jgi:AAA domain